MPSSRPGGELTDGELTLWLLDTRQLWPGSNIKEAASDALALLPVSEHGAILRKHHAADARMSFASALMKRHYVSRTLSVPWSEARLARRHDGQHGKPAALLPDGRFADLDFNVSHQAGVVTLIGYAPAAAPAGLGPGQDPAVLVGTDVTLPNERDDWRSLDRDGLDGFVDMFVDVFSDAEREDMVKCVDYVTLADGREVSGTALRGGGAEGEVKRGREVDAVLQQQEGGKQEETVTFDSRLIVEAKLRRFYAFFAYKEAYIKLAGEALLAPWLKELEFRKVRSPRAGDPASCGTQGMWGGREEGVEVMLKGKKVADTQMDLRAYDEGFMVASAIKGSTNAKLSDYDIELVDLGQILQYARSH